MAHGAHNLKHIDYSLPEPVHHGNGAVVASSKGRSRELISRRNCKLISRYYYHNAIMKECLAKTIEILEFEFDIDTYTISKILLRESEAIKELRQKKPSIDSLKKQYTWLKW